MEIVTSWERKGIEKGRLEGLTEGRTEGAVEALQSVLLDVLVLRFGVEPASIVARMQGINSVDELRQLTHRSLTVVTLRELGF